MVEYNIFICNFLQYISYTDTGNHTKEVTLQMNKIKQSVKDGAPIREADNYNDVNLAALDEHIESSASETGRLVYTLIQVNTQCEVTVTEESQRKLAKVVLS